MPFAGAISQHPLATHAVGEVVGSVLEQLGPAPDAAVLFVSAPFAGAMEDIAATVRTALRPGSLIGTTASGLIGPAEEVEGHAAISLFAMRFGPARKVAGPATVPSVVLDASRTGDGWQVTSNAIIDQPRSTLVLLADPFSFPVEAFVADLAGKVPSVTVVGGLASAATTSGGNRFVADDRVTDRGAVGLLLPPSAGARAVVSQGCRPVGDPWVVTKVHGNLIDEIAGQPALDRVLAVADQLDAADRQRMAQSLHLGIAADERKLDFDRGDFVIRAVLGADHERRAVAVGAEVEVGSTVQFHVRDAETATEDLRHLLDEVPDPQGALVFTCTSRGTNLFEAPHQDALAVSEQLPQPPPMAGMFCAGEIGPVAGHQLLHSMSASVLLLGAS